MNRSTILAFILSLMVFASVGAVAIILMPDNNPESYAVNKYDELNRQDYVFADTKNISLDSIEVTYEVNQDYLNKLLREQSYKPGTINPFYDETKAVESGSGQASGSTTTTTPSGSSSTGTVVTGK